MTRTILLPALSLLPLLLLAACRSSTPGPAPADAAPPPPPELDATWPSGDSPARPPDAGDPADAAPVSDATPSRPGWRLTWSDEFEGPAGTAPEPTRWRYDVGGDGWGNAELQHYTDRRDNSALDGNGNLAITARREMFGARSYTSARLNTSGRFAQAYGRIEARIRVPTGRGIWPAFWTLGQDIGQVSWPTCGEIDIMEQAGSRPSENVGSLHGPGYSGGMAVSRTYRLPDGGVFATDFHVFAVEWEERVVRFYVDDNLYATRTPMDLPANARWVFDHPFFIIVNVAVGGRFPGNPDDTTPFPQTMLVDYVRVYARP